MPLKILKTASREFKPKVNMLVYGHGGVGKTSFAATAPRPVFADCEGGTMYFGRRGIDVDVARIQTWRDMEEFYLLVKNSDYETVIIDPANEALEKLITQLKENPTLVNKTDGLTLQGWGVAKDRMRSFLKAIRDLDKHVIIVAHVDEKQDEGQTLKKRPKLQANLSQELIDMMDIVAYMQTIRGDDGTVRRILRVQPDSDSFEAKDRTATLGEIIEPDFKKIIEAVVENKQFVWTKKLKQQTEREKERFELGLIKNGKKHFKQPA